VGSFDGNKLETVMPAVPFENFADSALSLMDGVGVADEKDGFPSTAGEIRADAPYFTGN
jgi:hypothetical protein